MKCPSDTTKRKQKRGTGEREAYLPWIRVVEVPSSGCSSIPIDIYTKRPMQLLSRTESDLYYVLRWDTHVYDIREQFPLDLDETLSICEEYGVRHILRNGVPTPFTTDLLVTYTDGSLAAFSCKRNMNFTKRDIEKIAIEKIYWNRKNVPRYLITYDMLNHDMANNIRHCFSYYDEKYVEDEIQFLKHKIAHHEIDVDMESGMLDYEALAHKYILNQAIHHYLDKERTKNV